MREEGGGREGGERRERERERERERDRERERERERERAREREERERDREERERRLLNISLITRKKLSVIFGCCWCFFCMVLNI